MACQMALSHLEVPNMKYRHLAVSVLLASIGVAQAAPVTTVASEDFSYGSPTAGSINLSGLNGGTGWAGAWAGASAATVVGGAMQVAGNSNSLATRQLATSISRDVLVDFQFTLAAGAIDRNDFLGLWFGNFNGPNIGMKGNCDMSSGCTSDLFVRTNGSSGAFSTDLSLGGTVRLVGLLEKTGTSNVFNRYSLWVDPTADELDTLTGADAVYTGSSGLASFSSIGFRSVNLDGGDSLRIDNLKISLIPEPAALGLLGAAFLGASLATRRNKKA